MEINVYLSLAPKGIHAHILELPGCFTRGRTQEEALAALPGDIRAYLLDLQQHGENAEVPGEIEIHIAETDDQSTGPFDPGDTASLFAVEKRAISLEEMERYFQLADYNRADLLALVDGLADEVLDWKPNPESFTIRRILRHIGNADEWYVSRIVPPDAGTRAGTHRPHSRGTGAVARPLSGPGMNMNMPQNCENPSFLAVVYFDIPAPICHNQMV